MEILEKSRILYKGDMMAASFYIFVGVILLTFSIIIHYFTESPGFKFLSIGFLLLFVYCLGKGIFALFISKRRYDFYLNKNDLTKIELEDEIEYTDYRITKKNVNRRRYVYMVVICSVLAFMGIFSSYKSIIMGTSIPIALISGIELGVGLLTEFRLKEFLRILKKAH